MPARPPASKRSTSAAASAPSDVRSRVAFVDLSCAGPAPAPERERPRRAASQPNGHPIRGGRCRFRQAALPLPRDCEPARPHRGRVEPTTPAPRPGPNACHVRRRKAAKKPPSRQEKRWQDLRVVANLRHPASGPPGPDVDLGLFAVASPSRSVPFRHVPRYGGDALIVWSPDRLLSRGELWLRLPTNLSNGLQQSRMHRA